MDLLRGKHVTPKNKRDFLQICGSLGDFTGVMRLFGKISGDFCEADLLLKNGNVIAATCENLERGEILMGSDVLARVRGNFVKSGGRMDLYQFSDEDMEKTRKENVKAVLPNAVPLRSMGMRIKPLDPRVIRKSREDEKGLFGTISFRAPSVGAGGTRGLERRDVGEAGAEKGSLIQIREEIQRGDRTCESLVGKRISPKDVSTIFGRAPSTKTDARKQRLLQELKERRWVVDKEIAERISKLWEDKGEEQEGEERRKEGKVKTRIDELYELVKRSGAVKINDALAGRLGVSRVQIENWAVILEEHNLVELHYPAIGDPVMKVAER